MMNYIEKMIKQQNAKKIRKSQQLCNEACDDEQIIGESIAPKPDDSFTFDRFMNEIVSLENIKSKRHIEDDTPQRQYAKRYRESWLNSTRVNGQ